MQKDGQKGRKYIFRWVVTVIGALYKVYIPYRSLIEALYTLNSPPVVSFKLVEWVVRRVSFIFQVKDHLPPRSSEPVNMQTETGALNKKSNPKP